MTQSVADKPTPPAPRSRFDCFDEFASRPGRLWLVFFVYAAVVAALVQLVVLPYIFPQLHDGHGLLIEGDWVYHHRFTAELATRIREEGWSAWQLRPNGEYALHGISSAVYALIAPEPWTLILLHAALHATSTLLLVHILRLFVSSRGVAVVAALSFLLFPSSLITYAQITKDVYSICGGFMFLYGWLLLARWPEHQNRRRMIGIAVLIAGGATLAWTARPYLVLIMTGLSAGFASLVVMRMIVLSIRRAVPPIRGVLASAMAWLMVAMLIPFNSIGAGMYLADAPPSSPGAASPSAAASNSPAEAPRRPGDATRRPGDTSRPPGEEVRLSGAAVPPPRQADPPLAAPASTRRWGRINAPWYAPEWLPSAIDNRIYSLVLLRNRWKGTVGRSTVDQDVMPASPREIAAYLPRLMVVGFLAPFPAQWFEDGAFASTTLMRRAVGVEMLLTYVALVGLVLNVWRWRARLELWFVLAYGGVTTLIWAFIVPNIGSLYRARFGFLMVLVALGIAGMLSSRRIAGSRASVADK